MPGPKPAPLQLAAFSRRYRLSHVLRRVQCSEARSGRPRTRDMDNRSEPARYRIGAQLPPGVEVIAHNHNMTVHVPSALASRPLDRRDTVPLVPPSQLPDPGPESVEPLSDLRTRFASGQRHQGDGGYTLESTHHRLHRPPALQSLALGASSSPAVHAAEAARQPATVTVVVLGQDSDLALPSILSHLSSAPLRGATTSTVRRSRTASP